MATQPPPDGGPPAPALEDLVALGDRLAAAGLDEQAIVDATARSIGEALRCAAVVFVARDDLLIPEGVHHRDPDGAAMIRSIFESVPHATEGGLLGPVFQGGQPLIVPEVPDELLRTAYPLPEHGAYFDRFGVSSLVLSPMRSPTGTTLGVVAAAAERSRAPFTEADVLVATDLCRRVTLAIENARFHAEAAAAVSRLHAIVEASADAVITIDAHGTVIDANQATAGVFGWEPGELVGRGIECLMPRTTAERHRGFLDRYLQGGPAHVIGQRRIVEAVHRDGHEFWAELSVAELADHGRGVVFTGFVRDVTDRVARQAELARLADLDPLTGALNRRALTSRAVELLGQARRQGGSVTIAFVDLDRFKAVNDEHGHEAGDEVLRITADRIRSSIRRDDALGRWGGDEWVVAAPGAPGVDPVTEAGALKARVERAVHGPVRVADAAAPVVLSATVGCAVHPVDGDDFEQLVRVADRAMFAAKPRR